MLSAWCTGIPFVVTFHSGGHSSRLRNAVRGVQRAALRPLIVRAAALIAVSRFEAEFFSSGLRIPQDRFVVIPNGSNLPDLPVPAATGRDETLILSVGRLERYKGHHRVIAALPRVREWIPNVRLRIVGSGPYERQLQRHARDCGVADLVDVGPIPASDRAGMSALLSHAALVTLMSEYEAHPISVIEALAMGRPVLVADTSGLSEFAQAGHARAIPLNSTANEIAAAIVQQIAEPPIARVEVPSWDDCAASVLRVYQNIVPGGPPCAS
jgi:glycosyltransferase involved in cell wall biosynthesis